MKNKTHPDWKGTPQPVPKVKGRVLDERDDLGVTLVQQSRHRFAVTYGLSLKKDMDYGSAALEYGLCILHALAANGTLI